MGEIANGLGRVAAVTRRGPQRRGEHRPAEPRLQPDADPDQHPRAHHVEHRHHRERHQRGQGQDQEGVLAAAGHHPVEDLDHVQRYGQHQKVDDEAEGADGEERAPASADRAV